MVDKLGKIPGYKKEKYLSIIDKLDEWKVTSQNREKIYGASNTNQDKQSAKLTSQSNIPAGHVNYKQPRSLPSCRICQALKTQGVAITSFDGHLSDYATGCPRFAALSTDERIVVARETKYCINCMSKDVKYSFKHGRECPVKTKKNTYSCKKDSCLIHMWLCSKHKTENKDCMEKFATQLRSKSGITLVFQSNYKEPKHTAIDSSSQSSTQSNLKTTTPLAHCSTSN